MALFLWVCLGSAVGGGMRYLLVTAVNAAFGPFPSGTLLVNLAGSLLMGAVMVAGLDAPVLTPAARITLTSGVLGGFTTYSAFSYDTLQLVPSGQWSAGSTSDSTRRSVVRAAVSGVSSSPSHPGSPSPSGRPPRSS